ncbi:MAG: hypothetical protein JW724_02630, partial [Candidatus Altiarchaeota archaeon]|nr:hypothetical protein [Candidatus Altiarchaeota archaeon]
ERDLCRPPSSPPSRESGSVDAGAGQARALSPSAQPGRSRPRSGGDGEGGQDGRILKLQWVVKAGDVIWDKWVKWGWG